MTFNNLYDILKRTNHLIRVSGYLGITLVILAILGNSALAQTANISVGSDSGFLGESVTVSVEFTPGPADVSSLQFDLIFPQSLSYVSSTSGAALEAADKSLSSNAITGGVRFVIFGLNLNTIGSGVICDVQLNIAPEAAAGSIPVALENITASDTNASPVDISSTSGTITVLAPADTTPPVISSVTASSVTETGATISWTTNEASTSRVEYGTTTAYGNTTTLNTSMQTSHVQVLGGLTAGTAYHFRVLSMDEEGNLAVSGDYTFRTSIQGDTTPPEIGSVRASGITINGALISWTTNEASTSQVQYGTTTDYGNTTVLNTSMQTSHTQTLGELSMDTLYHYRVLSSDAAGNQAVSDDFTFTTMPDTTPPTIGSVIVSGQTGAEATVTWMTNEPSDTQIEYGTTAEYGNTTVLNTSMQNSHAQVLSGLTNGQLYHFRVLSSDEAGNLAISEDRTFMAIPQALTMALPLFTSGQISGSEELYFGMAITNMDAAAATIVFTAFDGEGNRIVGEGITNPAEYRLNPGAQLPLIDVQIFGDNLSQFHSNGWVRIEGTTDWIRGFFLTFDGQGRRMDGAGFVAERLNNFVFTDIEANGRTQVILINNNPDNANVTIDLVRANGAVRESVEDIIGAHGSVSAGIYRDLFNGMTPDSTDYIRVTSSQGLEAFLMAQQGTADISFIPAQDATEGAPTVYSPQYLFNRNYRTSLSVVNLDSTAGSVRFQLFSEDGVQIGKTEELLLEPNGKLYIDDAEFFMTSALMEEQVANVVRDSSNRIAGIMFGDSEERESASEVSLMDGYVKIESNGIRIAGNVMLRDRNRETFVSALPLISGLQQSLVFSHVASNDRYFTEIALVNPGDSTATVALNLYTAEGELLTGTTLSIPAQQRLCKPLTEILSSIQGLRLTNGYIRLSSDVPVAAYSIFGANDLSMLSAIPGQTEE